MKTLYLLRHAKSSWKDEDLDDKSRPLKKRGHFQADLISDHLSSLLPPAQHVLCSSAVRTRDTLTYFLEVWPLKKAAIDYTDKLYLAERDTYFSAVTSLSEDVEVAMIVGHNPGLSDFVNKVLRKESEGPGTLRTCAFLQIDFEVATWKEVKPRSGRLKLHLRPKDLEK